MKKRLDDKGFSLIELIIVLAIIAILSAAGFSMMGMMTGKYARQAAMDVESALSSLRTSTLTKSKGDPYDVWMAIRSDGSNLWVDIGKGSIDSSYDFSTFPTGYTGTYSEQLIGNVSRVTIVGEDTEGNTVEISRSNPTGVIKLGIKRSDSSFLPVEGAASTDFWKTIKFSQGVDYTLTLSHLTGNYTLN